MEGELSTNETLVNVGSTSLKKSVRSLMRHVPSSVAIITAAHRDPELKEHVPLGIAVSSFNTVTLDPPHISFNIKCPSKTLDAIRDAKGLFRVHLLSGTEISSRIVDNFSKGNTAEAYSSRKQSVPLFIPHSRDLAEATESVAPQIRGPSVVAALECELTQELPVADHIVVVAKVNTLVAKPELEGTLLYHEGTYKSADGSVLNKHLTFSAPEPRTNPDLGAHWKYPLFPGAAERDDFVKFLKSYLHRNSQLLEKSPKKTKFELMKALGLPSGIFGVDLAPLIEQCRVEAGHAPSLNETTRTAPLLADFYGRLGPREIATVVERTRKLVFANPMSLELHYKDLFSHVGLSTVSYGLLASDIVERLRSEGLVAPFESQASNANSSNAHLTIENLEDVEFKLRNFAKTKTYQELMNMTPTQLKEAIGVSDSAEEWITRVHVRLIVEAFPDIFNAAHIDIKGELTPEEVRVFVNRVIKYLSVENTQTMKRHMALPQIELLRRVGVHPLISNIDPDYLSSKLSFIIFQSEGYSDIQQSIDAMLAPMFEKRIFTWPELESRVRTFIRNHTLYAVKWPREDILAAMGIDAWARIKTPLSDNKPHILNGHMLPTLLAKEMKTYYGHGTAEENAAIKAFLKSQYNYDVVASVGSPDPASTTSSADEMREAMRRGLNVHVRKEDRQKMELQEALGDFGVRKDGGRKVAGVGVDGRTVGVPGWGRKGKERRKLMEREGWNRGAVKGGK